MVISAHPENRVHTHSPELDDASIGQLTSRLTEQLSHLVRDELALAQIEAKAKAKSLGVGIGMFGASGMLALFGALCGLAAGILGLANILTPWLAALVVGGALFLVAGMLALAGKRGLKKASPQLPTAAVASTKQDVATVREAVQR